MRIGILTVLLSNLSLDEVIKKIKPLGIRTIELGAANYPGNTHLNPDMLTSPAKLKEFQTEIE